MPDAGERRAWGWVAALRAGSTVPWAAWHEPADRTGRYLPGAQQLELLRRLNLAGPPGTRLVERVLAASAPGRGTPDLELVGATDVAPRFGPAPVDPADLPDAELARVATMLLAEDLVAAGRAEAAPTPAVLPLAERLPWRRHREYRLVGDAWIADPVRAALTGRGHPPGGRRPVVHVVGTDLATMVVHAFTMRAFDEGGPPFADWLGTPSRRGLPRRADLAGAAGWWAERVGADRVRVVLDPTLLPGLLLGRRGRRFVLPAHPSLSADAVDLARRVAAPLGLLVLPPERARLLRTVLLPRLAAHPGPALALPASHREWARRRARRLRRDLLAGGYAVHGDPDRLVPAASSTGGAPEDAGVLRLAVDLLLDQQHQPDDRGTEERRDR